MIGYEAVQPREELAEGQSLATGTWWESRTGKVRVLVVASNDVWVWFAWWGLDWQPWVGNTDIRTFTRAYHQMKTEVTAMAGPRGGIGV